MSANDTMAQVINRTVIKANDLGTRFGFELAKLAVVGLLYDEMTAAHDGGKASVESLIAKVRALQLPVAPSQVAP